jgi:hypothetical protein
VFEGFALLDAAGDGAVVMRWARRRYNPTSKTAPLA